MKCQTLSQVKHSQNKMHVVVKGIWAESKGASNVGDCYFYHTMNIPNHGLAQSEWDLRGRRSTYLGNVNLQGKRVLEIRHCERLSPFYDREDGS